ncbi:hypothetical protein PITC_088180 [Penicillium italicum]|uniref:Uncharacterized protein n=1 Tax=Penicillium italicum TaxID=40296 RepID=A0A0A2L978_PENIT|nr:hypothetical protein PITC_088180 [Penicillium italicum]
MYGYGHSQLGRGLGGQLPRRGLRRPLWRHGWARRK